MPANDGQTSAWPQPVDETAAASDGFASLVLRHCTDMEIQRQYVDSHGQSAVGFAFCRLLGFELDRKSAVEGEGVSVRVDLGGGGIIKEKNKRLHTIYT